MTELDITDTIQPKSDQLNADDLIGGPITITITRVSKTGAPDQPFSVGFEGDRGKPFKPSLGMRRVMVKVWGADANRYVGRSMTLYNDPEVTFGRDKVGGIRISHMSHIDRPVSLALTVAKARRKQYTVQPLRGHDGGGGNGGHVSQDQTQGGEQQRQAPDFDTEQLTMNALSTAEGGTQIYQDWFVTLPNAQKHYLTTATTIDRDDFDKEKIIHELCKSIANRVV